MLTTNSALSHDSMKILFVCDGNICRSPMAEALLLTALSDRGIDWIEVTSAGLVASQWGVAHGQLRRVLGASFAHVENRRSVPMSEELVEDKDLVLGMEKRHVRQIHERFPKIRATVDLVTTFAGRDGEIKDFPESGYVDLVNWLRNCHSIMLPSVELIVDRLVRENGTRPKVLPKKVD
jgi:protein-tyrosine-phosphatase